MAGVVDTILDVFKGMKGIKPQNILSNFDDYFSSATSTLTKDMYGEITDSVYDEVKTQYQKNLKGTSFWDKKRNQQLVYDGVDNIHGGHNFYTREGTLFNVPDSDIGGLTQYKGKNKLDHATLEGYSNAMMDLEYMDDKLKYTDPDKYYTNVKNKIEQIDAYEKKIGSGYKNFKGNKDYHRRRGWMADDVNKHFGSEVISKNPLNQTTARNTATATAANNVNTNASNTTKNTTAASNNRRTNNERQRQDRTRNSSQENINRRNNQRRKEIVKNTNTTVNKNTARNVINDNVNAVDETLENIVNKPIDSMSTGNKRYIKNQQAKAWKKEMVKPKNVTFSHYENMINNISGVHEYAKSIPKPVFPLDPNTPMEEVQKQIQQYNKWHSAQMESKNLKFLGRDLKQIDDRYKRAQANIDETIANQKKNEAIEKEYQEWKQKQKVDSDHAEAIEMNKQYDMESEAYEMNRQYDMETEAYKMNEQYDLDRQQYPDRVHNIDEAWDEAIDEDIAREMARQRQLEEELPDIFKNESDKPSVNPNTGEVIQTNPDDIEIINPEDAPEVITNNVDENIGSSGGSGSNTPPKDRRPKMDDAPKNELIVTNNNQQVGNSRLNVDDYDDNIIEGTFRVLDDAPEGPKMPSKASVLGTAGAVIGAISDYKNARRKGHGVVSSGLRAAGSFVIGEMLGWKAQLGLMAVRAIPGAVVKGADMLYKENRRMNSAANQQVFGGSQFQDTQQLATMRQSGMEMAKMSQYNLQQTLMGNEATYLHR